MDFITAAKLAELRKQNGYSQEALAEKLGLSRQAISKWERAESSPDTDNLIALASLYGMTLDGLLNTSSASLQDTPQEPTEENSSRGEQEKTDLKKSARTEKKSERKGGRLQRMTRREQIKATPAVFPKAASFL